MKATSVCNFAIEDKWGSHFIYKDLKINDLNEYIFVISQIKTIKN